MEIIKKEVDFNGAKLLAVKNQEKIYVGVSYVCSNLGMTENQINAQRQKMQSDETLKIGIKKLSVKIHGQVREQIFIELDYLPLWLAKINPARFSDELKDKLLKYQLHAKDVLAKAFLGKSENQVSTNYMNRDYTSYLNEIHDRENIIRGLEVDKKKLIEEILRINRLIQFNYHMISGVAKDLDNYIEIECKKFETEEKITF